MPRIPAAIAVVMLVATCIGFNTARFPVVLEMAAVQGSSQQPRLIIRVEDAEPPADLSSGDRAGDQEESERAGQPRGAGDADWDGSSGIKPSRSGGKRPGSKDSPWGNGRAQKESRPVRSVRPVVASIGRAADPAQAEDGLRGSVQAREQPDRYADGDSGPPGGMAPSRYGYGDLGTETEDDPADSCEESTDPYESAADEADNARRSSPASNSYGNSDTDDSTDSYGSSYSSSDSDSDTDDSADSYGSSYGGLDEDSYGDPYGSSSGDASWARQEPPTATTAEGHRGGPGSHAGSAGTADAAVRRPQGLDLVPVAADSGAGQAGQNRFGAEQSARHREENGGGWQDAAETGKGVIPLPPVDGTVSPPNVRPTPYGSIPIYPSTNSA